MEEDVIKKDVIKEDVIILIGPSNAVTRPFDEALESAFDDSGDKAMDSDDSGDKAMDSDDSGDKGMDSDDSGDKDIDGDDSIATYSYTNGPTAEIKIKDSGVNIKAVVVCEAYYASYDCNDRQSARGVELLKRFREGAFGDEYKTVPFVLTSYVPVESSAATTSLELPDVNTRINKFDEAASIHTAHSAFFRTSKKSAIDFLYPDEGSLYQVGGEIATFLQRCFDAGPQGDISVDGLDSCICSNSGIRTREDGALKAVSSIGAAFDDFSIGKTDDSPTSLSPAHSLVDAQASSGDVRDKQPRSPARGGGDAAG